MREENPNNQDVFLIHTGDREKQWDAKSDKIRFRKEEPGEPEDMVIHYVWGGNDGIIYPGEKFVVSRGLAVRIIEQKTGHIEMWVFNYEKGKTERMPFSIPPPLIIKELETARGDNCPIGRKLEGKEAAAVEFEKPEKHEFPSHLKRVDSPDERTTKKGKKKPEPPKPTVMPPAQLKALPKAGLKKILEGLHIDVVNGATRPQMVEAIIENQTKLLAETSD